MAIVAFEASEVIGFVLKGLAGGVLSKGGGEGIGLILSAVLGIGDDQKKILEDLNTIKQDLKDLKQKVDELSVKLDDAVGKIINEIRWNDLIVQASPGVNQIESRYQLLLDLGKTSEAPAKDLRGAILPSTATDLFSLNSIILGDSNLDPGKAGLLGLFVASVISKLEPSSGRQPLGAGSALHVAEKQITKYFLYLISVQLKGLTLLVNYYHASNSPDLADKAIEEMRSRFLRQAEIYRVGLEALTVAFCGDQSLLGLFGGRDRDISPVLAADQVIADIFNTVDVVVRIWGGRGQGAFPFDTRTFVARDAAGPTLALAAESGGSITPTAGASNEGRRIGFPSRDSAEWSLFRFVFRNPPDGTYRIQPGVGNMPFWNCWIDPAQFVRKYSAAEPTLKVEGSPPSGPRKSKVVQLMLTGSPPA